MQRLLILMFLSFFSSAIPDSIAAQTPLNGYWEGVIADAGKEMRFNVEFTGEANQLKAHIDIPDLYIFDYTLTNVRYDSSRIHFELSLGREPEKFEGTVSNRNISGEYSGRFYKEEPHTAAFKLWREKRDARYRREDVSFSSGDVKLAGTLFVPLRKGPHPAIVLVHGSGPQTRESYLKYFADLFARDGFATLIYDKRGTGESTGQIWYRTGDNFKNLVSDALAGVEFLINRSDINRKHVGVWGLSQGGWLAPMAAARSKDIAFVVVISGGGVTPAEQELYDDEVKLRDRGFSEAEVNEAVGLLKMADNVIRKRTSWEAFAAVREKAKQKPWYELLDKYPVKLPREDDTWRSDSAGLDLDPRRLWQSLEIPVLALFGESDKSTPAQESADRIKVALTRGGNKHYRIEIFPHADHGLWVSPEKGKWDWDQPAHGWLEMMSKWVEKQR